MALLYIRIDISLNNSDSFFMSMVNGWFCHSCKDDIGNNVKGVGDVPPEHADHEIQHQNSMSKCNICERLSGGYRENTMCYDPKCEGTFIII